MNTNGRKAGRCPTGPGEDFQRIAIILDVIADERNEALAATALLNFVDYFRQEGIETAWLTFEISCPLSSVPSLVNPHTFTTISTDPVATVFIQGVALQSAIAPQSGVRPRQPAVGSRGWPWRRK